MDDIDYAYGRLDELRNLGFIKSDYANYGISLDGIVSGYSGSSPWLFIPKTAKILNNVNPSGDGWLTKDIFAALFLPSGLTSILDPNGKGIGKNIAYIAYNNTMANWAKVTKASTWNTGIKATSVVCTDGSVNL